MGIVPLNLSVYIEDDVTSLDNSNKKLTAELNDQSDHVSDDYTKVEDLYPIRNEFNPTLSTAIQLLLESIDYVNESYEMLIDGDIISSDDAVHKFQALLPELFCCRTLGDGFGLIVNSIFNAINNLNGTPLNKNQLKAILKLLKRIYSEPYIDFEEASEELISIEELGLIFITSDIKYLTDLLNG